MELMNVLFAVAGYAAVPALVSAWLIEKLRSRRRNAAGKCAACGVAWSEITSPEHFLIHGRLVCEGCATRARGRLGWQFGFLGAAALFASLMILISEGPVIFALMPPATVSVMAVAGIGLMRRANRRAQAQVAAGTYPFLLAGEDRRLDEGE